MATPSLGPVTYGFLEALQELMRLLLAIRVTAPHGQHGLQHLVGREGRLGAVRSHRCGKWKSWFRKCSVRRALQGGRGAHVHVRTLQKRRKLPSVVRQGAPKERKYGSGIDSNKLRTARTGRREEGEATAGGTRARGIVSGRERVVRLRRGGGGRIAMNRRKISETPGWVSRHCPSNVLCGQAGGWAANCLSSLFLVAWVATKVGYRGAALFGGVGQLWLKAASQHDGGCHWLLRAARILSCPSASSPARTARRH